MHSPSSLALSEQGQIQRSRSQRKTSPEGEQESSFDTQVEEVAYINIFIDFILFSKQNITSARSHDAIGLSQG
jgi:hypothetical protein